MEAEPKKPEAAAAESEKPEAAAVEPERPEEHGGGAGAVKVGGSRHPWRRIRQRGQKKNGGGQRQLHS